MLQTRKKESRGEKKNKNAGGKGKSCKTDQYFAKSKNKIDRCKTDQYLAKRNH
jgi:hypothetical protein